jgi:predicted DNA-binding transcriptional regulator AlpA
MSQPHIGTVDRLLNIKAITERIPVHHATIRREIARGKFPPPIKIGIQNFWRESAVDEYLAAKQAEALEQQAEILSRTP